MIKSYQQRLAEYLLEKKLLTQEVFNSLIEQSNQLNKPIEELILSGNIIDEEKLVEAKGKIFGVPYINLVDIDINKDVFDILPENIINSFRAVSFFKQEKEVQVALVDPNDVSAHEAIDFLLSEKGLLSKYFVTSRSSYQSAIRQYQKIGTEVETVLEQAKEKIEEFELPEEKIDEKVSNIVKKAPVSQVVSLIFKHAVDNKASDIHIEPDETESRVRYRIDGVLTTFLILPAYIHASVVSRIKVLAKLKLDETRIPQDGRIKIKINNQTFDLRVSTLPLLNNEKVSIRLLETAAEAPSLEDLGFNKIAVKILEQEMKSPHGIFLITGPTGSGKSTTLYSILSMINKDQVNIVTLEDPIEYYIDGVNQSLIRADIGYTFSSGLRSILRQDPNIIMVGEVRDTETAELAVHAGLTGHLLFSTLHTNDAFGVVPRLIDMKVEPFLLSSTLNLVVAQRLVRKVCQDCKEKRQIPDEIAQELKKELKDLPKELLKDFDLSKNIYEYVGKGCSKCSDEGYKGRTVVAEVLQITPQLKKLILSGFDMDAVRKEANRQNMINLRHDGLLKVLNGTTTLEEVMRVAEEEEEEVFN